MSDRRTREPATRGPYTLVRYVVPCHACHGRGHRVRVVQPLARLPLLVARVHALLASRGLTTLHATRAAWDTLLADPRFGVVAVLVVEQAIYSGDRKTLARLFPSDPAAIQADPLAEPEPSETGGLA